MMRPTLSYPYLTRWTGAMDRYEPHAMSVLSGYEFAALVSGRVPTLTTLWKRLPDRLRRALRPVLVAVLAVWAWVHFD